MSAFDFGFSYGEDGASMECLFDNIDYAVFEDCTTQPDFCPEVAPNGCSEYDMVDSNITSTFECMTVPAAYGASCPESPSSSPTASAPAGGLPTMALYATAFLWALRKFTF